MEGQKKFLRGPQLVYFFINILKEMHFYSYLIFIHILIKIEIYFKVVCLSAAFNGTGYY